MGTETDTQGSLDAIPWQSSAFYVILSCSLIGVMGVSLITPALPQLRQVFGISDQQVGLVITAYTLPGVFLTPFIGLAADRFGRRRIVIPLLFTFGLAGASVSFAGSFTQVLALRFVQGVGATALVTLAVTLIGDFYDGDQQNAIMGFNGSIMGTGGALYPLIGGTLASIRWNAPFLFFGIAIIIGLLATVGLSEPESTESVGVVEYLSRIRDVVLLPEALGLFVALFVVFFVFFGAIQTALPLLMSDEFRLGSGQIGILLSMVAVASGSISFLYGRLAQWRTPKELIALGFVAFGLSFLGIWMAPSPLFVGLALLGSGVAFGVVIPSIDTTVVTLVSSQFRAGMMGVRTSMIRLGQTLGPLGCTYVAETGFETTSTGYRLLLLAFGVSMLVVGAGTYLLFQK